MSRIRTVGLALGAVLVLCGLASASASAAVPELGRCVPASPAKTGEYTGPHCLKPAAGKGKYNFIPGPGEKKKFTGSGTEPKLVMPKLTVSCAGSSWEGEYTGPKTASVTPHFVGCVDVATGQLCQTSPAKASEIETLGPAEGEIGFIEVNGHKKVGLDLKRASGPLATFECGKLPETTTIGAIEGSVIGELAPTNSMHEEFKLKYRVVAGKQVPEQFEGGPKDTLTVKLISGLSTSTEEAVLQEKLVEITNEEALEIKAK